MNDWNYVKSKNIVWLVVSGRPDWGVVLPEVIDDMKQTVMTNPHNDNIKPKLYACGPAVLCKDLRHHCSKLNISFKEEVFG